MAPPPARQRLSFGTLNTQAGDGYHSGLEQDQCGRRLRPNLSQHTINAVGPAGAAEHAPTALPRANCLGGGYLYCNQRCCQTLGTSGWKRRCSSIQVAFLQGRGFPPLESQRGYDGPIYLSISISISISIYLSSIYLGAD